MERLRDPALGNWAQAVAVPLAVCLTCITSGGVLWAGEHYAWANILFAVGSFFGAVCLGWTAWCGWVWFLRPTPTGNTPAPNVEATAADTWAWLKVTNKGGDDDFAVQVEWHRRDDKPYLALWREGNIAWQRLAPEQTCTANIATINGWTGQQYIPMRFYSDSPRQKYWDEKMRNGDKIGCTITVLRKNGGPVSPQECDLEIVTASTLRFAELPDHELPLAMSIGPLQLQREIRETAYEAWNGIVHRCYLRNRAAAPMRLNAALRVALNGRDDIQVRDQQAGLWQTGRMVEKSPFLIGAQESKWGDIWFGPFKAERDAGVEDNLWLDEEADRRWSHVEFTDLISGKSAERCVYDPDIMDD